MLNSADEQQLIRLLQNLQQPLSAAVYNALASKLAMTAIEVVFLREIDNKLSVLLTPRPPQDAYYGGQLHSPGTILRSDDANQSFNYAAAFERVLKEIGVEKYSIQPYLVDILLHKTKRGAENALIFLADFEGNSQTGRFYDLEKLLSQAKAKTVNLVPHHVEVLERASAGYKKTALP